MKKAVLLLFILMIIGCTNKPETNDGPVPTEVAFKEGYIKHLVPPNNFKASLAWMQTIHDTRKEGNSKVEVDWLKLYARVDGEDKLILMDEYNEKACGGLWKRNPWFGSVLGLFQTGGLDEFPVEIKEGILIIEPHERPKKVWHWWTCERAEIPSNIERVWMEARVRITGPALVQTGIDFWRDLKVGYAGKNVNNVEAAVSDWYFEDEEWQIITLAKP